MSMTWAIRKWIFSLQFSDNTLENNMKSAFFWSKLLEGTSSHFDTHLLAVISSALKLLSIRVLVF